MKFKTLLDVDGTLLPERQELAARGTDCLEEGDENGEDATVASDMDAVMRCHPAFPCMTIYGTNSLRGGFRQKRLPSSMRPITMSARQNSFPT